MKNALSALLVATIIALGGRSASAQDTVQIFAIEKDGTGLKELTKGYVGIGQVRFSPDGSKLLFHALFFDAPRPLCGMGGISPNGKLFLMNSDGSDLHEIHGYSSAFDPIFTPDGKKILFTEFDISDGTCRGKLLGIYSMNLDGTEARLIVPDAAEANISPDGSKLVFRKAFLGAIFISSADGSDARHLGNFGGPYVSVSGFNPKDSSEIMFVNSATSTISTINVSTLIRRVVTQGPNDRRRGVVMMLAGASYSLDGNSVVYAMAPDDAPRPITLYDRIQVFPSNPSHFEIYEVAPGGTAGRQITDNKLLRFPYGSTDPSSPAAYTQAYSPSYSPDGKTIVFVGRTGR